MVSGAGAASGAALLSVLAQVGAGGAIGAMARHLLVRAAAPLSHSLGANVGVTLANLFGGFAIGVAFLLFARFGLLERWGPFFITGVLGGFTTFSAFSWDALSLLQEERLLLAFAYVAANVVGAIGAAALGAAAARWWLGG
ncbi:MAG: CrcB family protein [Pseudomonadota bacterium]